MLRLILFSAAAEALALSARALLWMAGYCMTGATRLRRYARAAR